MHSFFLAFRYLKSGVWGHREVLFGDNFLRMASLRCPLELCFKYIVHTPSFP